MYTIAAQSFQQRLYGLEYTFYYLKASISILICIFNVPTSHEAEPRLRSRKKSFWYIKLVSTDMAGEVAEQKNGYKLIENLQGC